MGELMQGLPAKVLIREVGPREGFQILPKVYATEQKLKIITALVKAGLTSIEVASFVRPDRLPQMADAEQIVAGLPDTSECEFTALYLNQKGFERGEATGRLRNRGWLYTAASESFLRANNNCSIADTFTGIPTWIESFRRAGKDAHGLMVSTAFGCNYEGPIETSKVADIVSRFVKRCEELGSPLSEICLADTVGRANPRAISDTVTAVRSLGVEISLHLHDTWGLGMVNVFSGLECGVSIYETSIGGIGGCPFTPGAAGNVATEEVVYLCHSLGIKTGIDLVQCCRAASLAQEVIGTTLPGRIFGHVDHLGKFLQDVEKPE
jgi:hydroxymethylglutaryl-CoA lyase